MQNSARLIALLTAVFLSSCFTGDIYVGGVPFVPQDGPLRRVIVYPEDSAGETGSCLGTPVGTSGPKIFLISIDGVIGEGGWIPGETTTPAYVHRMLSYARAEGDVSAILLRINSPGGTVSDSNLIYRMLNDFKREANVPVYAHITDIGASGAYYVAMSSEHINARPTALVGSIGVILRSFTVTGLLEKLGIDYHSIASGENKDTLSPFRELREDERERLEQRILKSYDQFLGIILESRSRQLNETTLRRLADGQVYDADVAKNERLIDSVGYFEDFIEEIKRKRGLPDAVVVTYVPEQSNVRSVYDLDARLPVSMEHRLMAFASLTGHRLFYLWEAGL